EKWSANLEQTVANITNLLNPEYSFYQVANGKAELKIDGKFETISSENVRLTGTITGNADVDTSTGLTTHTQIEQFADMTIETEGTKVEMRMTGKIVIDIK